jgi:hypothetical protein
VHSRNKVKSGVQKLRFCEFLMLVKTATMVRQALNRMVQGKLLSYRTLFAIQNRNNKLLHSKVSKIFALFCLGKYKGKLLSYRTLFATFTASTAFSAYKSAPICLAHFRLVGAPPTITFRFSLIFSLINSSITLA